MPWKVWGQSYSTTELTDTSIYQPIIFDRNYILRAIRTWVIIYNNPTFTSLNLKLYSGEGLGATSTPKKLLHTSTNVQLKADIHTEANAVKEIWFEFDKVSVRAGDTYHFVLNGSGYTGSATSHIAWRRGFPDPVYVPPGGLTLNHLTRAPFFLYAIGSRLF